VIRDLFRIWGIAIAVIAIWAILSGVIEQTQERIERCSTVHCS
jgi:hypothetical protein